MRYKTDSHIDELLFDMDVGNGWTVTDVWFDHDIPVEKIDCIKVKFERVKKDRPSHCDNCKDWICEWCSYGQPKDEPQYDAEEVAKDINRRVDMVKKEWEVRHIEPKDEPQTERSE